MTHVRESHRLPEEWDAGVMARVFKKIEDELNRVIEPIALTSTSGSIAVNAAQSDSFTHTLTENTTLANPTKLTPGKTLFFRFQQHASAAKTLAFGSKYKFSTADTHVMPTGASAVAIMSCYYHAPSDRLECVFNTGGTGFA